MKLKGTKYKIFLAAVQLFSNKNYNAVSMREIADLVGIRVSSLYNHFKSKEDILLSMYDYYSVNLAALCPNIELILEEIPNSHPQDILKKLQFHYKLENIEIMQRIIAIAITDRNSKPSADFLQGNLIMIPNDLLRPVLNKMIECNKIAPLNVDAFINLMSCFTFGVAARNNSSFSLSLQEYCLAFGIPFTLIKPLE